MYTQGEVPSVGGAQGMSAHLGERVGRMYGCMHTCIAGCSRGLPPGPPHPISRGCRPGAAFLLR